MRTPSSPVLRTRPCPTFGRPVRLGFPHRLRPGTSPHALRIPPHGGHPALRSTASSGSRSALAVSSFRLRARLDVSIPSAFFGQRGITPAFGYGAPHPSARGTLTLLNTALLNAQYLSFRFPDLPSIWSVQAPRTQASMNLVDGVTWAELAFLPNLAFQPSGGIWEIR